MKAFLFSFCYNILYTVGWLVNTGYVLFINGKVQSWERRR